MKNAATNEEKDDWIFKLIVFLKHESTKIEDLSRANCLDMICMPTDIFVSDETKKGSIYVNMAENIVRDDRTPEQVRKMRELAKAKFVVFYHDLYPKLFSILSYKLSLQFY
jgi:hypothetical protein